MAAELRMPSLGMTMEEGRVVAWRVKPGDLVSRGQILVEIESEKVAYEVESPADGVVGPILVAADAVVPVGTLLVSILAHGETAAPAAPPAQPRAAAPAPARPSPTEARPGGARPRLSPRARALAAELGVDVARLAGTGPGGTVVEEDIRRAARTPVREAVPPPRAGEVPFVLKPLSGMRRTIADRMAESARTAPHFFLAIEVDGSALLTYRAAHAARFAAERGVKLTLTDLLLRVTARTLRSHPTLNASYTPEGIREWQDVNLGLAVAIDEGLIVPVVRQADARSLVELAATRTALVERARARKLTADDLVGGTFTVSNLGGFGIDLFSSILNPPQAGILSVGALAERAVVVGGAVVARPTMTIGLTIDHRVTDGATGSRFLGDLRARIEHGRVDE